MNLSNELKKYSFLESAKKIAENLNLPVYIVGGFVRDIILSRIRVDIDFLIVGNGDLFAREFARELGVKNVVISYLINSRNIIRTLRQYQDSITLKIPMHKRCSLFHTLHQKSGIPYLHM